MQVAAPIVGIVVLLWGAGAGAFPSADLFKSAFSSALEYSRAVGTSDTGVIAPFRECPLRKFHGVTKAADINKNKETNAIFSALNELRKTHGLSWNDFTEEFIITELNQHADTSCPLPTHDTCDPNSRYRTADGSCNNLLNPTWGMPETPQERLMESAYDDGLNAIRSKGVNGCKLPNPRRVSNAVHRADNPVSTDKDLTLQAFQMGQFLDHDIIETPTQTEIKDCCGVKDDNNCANIIIQEDDIYQPYYHKNYCMNFPRSTPMFCRDQFSNIPKRQQTNFITSFVDASNVYGSTLAKQLELRADGGKSAFMKTGQGMRLPINPDQTGCSSSNSTLYQCVDAGDARANIVPSLTTYHTAFAFEHNRIAAELRSDFSDNETLFQETRRIMIAIMQDIVYNEFLPSFMSLAALKHFGLLSSSNTSKPFQYDNKIKPTILNEFGIAYRMGHTWVPPDMTLQNQTFDDYESVSTSSTFFDPKLTYYETYENNITAFQGLAYWLTGANSEETDAILDDVVRNELFIDNENRTAFDLASLNIQRGRDHGLQSYNAHRMFCNLSSVHVIWEDLPGKSGLVHHSPENIQRLKLAGYKSPLDIDMYTGILSESPVEGGSVGPTTECLLGEQFKRLKYGDRYWYEGEAAGFSKAQIAAIEKYSMAKILCVNYLFTTINFPNAFLATDQRTPCANIPALDLSVFKYQF